MRKRFILLCCILGIITVVVAKVTLDNNKEEESISVAENKEELVYINYDDELTQAIDNVFSKDEQDNVSISIYIPNSEYSFDSNEEKNYLSASTIKLPIALYLYDIAQEDSSMLNTSLVYQSSDYEEGTGSIQYEAIGTSYRVETLIEKMIVESDNVAANMLLRNYFENAGNLSNELTAYFGDADYINRMSNSENKMHALKYLYDNQEDYSNLISYLKNVENKERIPKYLEVDVANKIGTYDSTILDYGIVYGNSDYLITISTDGIEEADEKIALVSQEIYEIIE